ncbi:MAG: hypothetical protein ACREA5_03625 [Nitrosotalea sp.]
MTSSKGRTSFITNHRLLLFCLLSLAIIGTTYYYLDNRKEVHQTQWLAASIVWYGAIGFSIIKVLSKIRIGYLIAGIVSWMTLVFWMLDNCYLVFQTTVIAIRPDYIMTIRNFIGVAIAAFGILSSHNAFHKIN